MGCKWFGRRERGGGGAAGKLSTFNPRVKSIGCAGQGGEGGIVALRAAAFGPPDAATRSLASGQRERERQREAEDGGASASPSQKTNSSQTVTPSM